MLNGQLRPDRGAGSASPMAADLIGLPPRRRCGAWAVGRTFQITATFASMTVRENVQMALLSHAAGICSPLQWPARNAPRNR